MTDLPKPISESTHSNTDCWPSSALATAVMCGIYNFQVQSILTKKESNCLSVNYGLRKFFLDGPTNWILNSPKISYIENLLCVVSQLNSTLTRLRLAKTAAINRSTKEEREEKRSLSSSFQSYY